MKRQYTFLLFFIVYLFQSNSITLTCAVTPLYTPRDLGTNAARELSGLTNHICIWDMEKFYGTVAITPEYMRAFDTDRIPLDLFGTSILNNCQTSTIVVSGSGVANRAATDWLADYALLPTDFQSRLTFTPQVQNELIDFYLYLGLDEWLCGLFAFVHTPVVNSRWKLGYQECNITEGSTDYSIGYFTPDAISRSSLRKNFTEYVSGCSGLDLGNNILVEPLNFARMSCDTLSTTALADIRFAVGWNFLQNFDYHLGIGLLAAAPTGTRPKGEFLFEPFIGNGHRWEFGGLLWGHATFWRSECEEKFFSGWIQANITHMFKAHQFRFFDLKCKPNSRYMLAEKMSSTVNLLLANETAGETAINSTVPSNQFNSLYAPVANLTRQEVDSSINVQADIVVLLNYTSCGFSWDLGYDFWATTCETITPNSTCPPRLFNERWALKGDASVFGFTDSIIGSDPVGTPVALSATESSATIHAGTNAGSTINQGVDNRQWAVAGANQMATALLLNTPGGTQTQTSKEPVLLTMNDIDFNTGTKGLSQKFFTHFSYSWLNNEDWCPYLGFGAEIEFAQKNDSCQKVVCSSNPCNSCTTTTCSSNNNCFSCLEDNCRRTAFSQWGVWIKFGTSFN